MKKFLVFIRWFFRAEGITKVHPAMVPGIAFVPDFIGKHYYEHKCVICGDKFWSYKDKKVDVCTTWFCFRDYHLNGGKRSA